MQMHYPTDLNPFGDEEVEGTAEACTEAKPLPMEKEAPAITIIEPESDTSVMKPARSSMNSDAYDNSLNPFGDEAEDTPTLRRSPKKKAAPPPPSGAPIPGKQTTSSSVSASPSPSQKSIPPPAPNVIPQASSTPVRASSGPAPPAATREYSSAIAQRKKRPAPSVSVPMKRELQTVSLKAILAEMKDIEKRQQELEDKGKDAEVRLRHITDGAGVPDEGSDGDSSAAKHANNDEEEELMVDLFELLNEKNNLFRRQAELNYIKRYQRLEEEQIELEYQIGLLLQKPASQKTNEDTEKEQKMIERLVEVVELRNEIVDAQEMDRQRLSREDEDIEIQRSRMHSQASQAQSPIDDQNDKKKDKKKKKAKKEKKSKEKDKDADKESRKTLKKMLKEKYKTLKHSTATLSGHSAKSVK